MYGFPRFRDNIGFLRRIINFLDNFYATQLVYLLDRSARGKYFDA